MKALAKSIMAALLTVCFSISLSAQILYKVESPDSGKTSYILGTHHLAPLSAVDSLPELRNILKSVDKLYGEVDMSLMTDPATMLGLQGMLIAPADSTIDAMLAPAQLDSVRNAWESYGGAAMPFDMIKMMKPALISTQLASLIIMKDLPEINPMEGIDITMQNRARELGKPVAGLETLEYQMEMIYGTPISRQIEELMEIVRDIDKQSDKASALNEAYLAHDINKLLELMQDSEDNDTETIDRLIYGRNDNWVSQLKNIMPGQSVFVVVGAGHLPGDRGVLEGLRAAGFIVTPME